MCPNSQRIWFEGQGLDVFGSSRGEFGDDFTDTELADGESDEDG